MPLATAACAVGSLAKFVAVVLSEKPERVAVPETTAVPGATVVVVAGGKVVVVFPAVCAIAMGCTKVTQRHAIAVTEVIIFVVVSNDKEL